MDNYILDFFIPQFKTHPTRSFVTPNIVILEIYGYFGHLNGSKPTRTFSTPNIVMLEI